MNPTFYAVVGIGVAVVAVLLLLHHGTLSLKQSVADQMRALPGLVATHARQFIADAEARGKADLAAAHAEVDKLRAEFAARLTPPAAAVAPIAGLPPVPVAADQPPQPSTVSGGTGVGTALSADGHVLTITTQAPYVPNPQSNTPDWRKFTDTSPAGYPMEYQLNADGTVALDASGHPIAQVKFDGKLFADDQAVALYRQGQASKA